MLNYLVEITREKTVERSVADGSENIYLYILFPIAFGFLVAFGLARLFSHLIPELGLHFINVRIHHYSYGFFILAISGYLAMVNESPGAKYLIALLHGIGLGMAFDEFGIWLNLTDDSAARYSYDGVLLLAGIFLLIVSAEAGRNMWTHHFGRKNIPKNPYIGPISGY